MPAVPFALAPSLPALLTVALPAHLPPTVTVPRRRGVFVVADAGVAGYICIVVIGADLQVRDIAFIAEGDYTLETLAAFDAWLDVIDPAARPQLRAVS